jgi:hypothetical protein
MQEIRAVHAQGTFAQGASRETFTGDCGAGGWRMQVEGTDAKTGIHGVVDFIATGQGFSGHNWVRLRTGASLWSAWTELTGDNLLPFSFYWAVVCPQQELKEEQSNGASVLGAGSAAHINDLGPALVGGQRAEHLRVRARAQAPIPRAITPTTSSIRNHTSGCATS